MGKRFGAQSTGEEVLDGIDLTGKTIVLTGGNTGLGKETTRVLAKAGADVIFTSRNREAGDKVAAELQQSGVKGNISVQQLDLANLASVKSAAAELTEKCNHIDVLILNAGVMGTPLQYTKDGFEMQIGTNHFGHWYLTQQLLPKMQKQDFPSRIVVLSSKAHFAHRTPLNFEDLHYKGRKYSGFGGYAQSKTANVLFAKQLADRVKDSKISVFSLHPGSILTDLPRHWVPDGSWKQSVICAGMRWLPSLGEIKTLPQGVSTTVYAAVSPDLEGRSGAYLSNCAIAQPTKVASDPQQAAKLWEVTEEQINAALAQGAET